MKPRAPLAVLWDMDGTLVDTEPYWMTAEISLVQAHGGTWTHEQSLELVGLGLEDAGRVFQRAGVRMPVREIVDTLTTDVMRQLSSTGVPFQPGARELLQRLRNVGIATALVTMSLRRMADAVIELIDFEAFDVVIAGDDAARPKPHPDPYLQACQALGVAPGDALSIEDSPNGVRSAVAAGTVTLGVPHVIALEGSGASGIWETLDGRTVDDIGAFFHAHARTAP